MNPIFTVIEEFVHLMKYPYYCIESTGGMMEALHTLTIQYFKENELELMQEEKDTILNESRHSSIICMN